jgi:hypothetical protein
MDEPTANETVNILEWNEQLAKAATNCSLRQGHKETARVLNATIRRHAELVRLCREYIEARNANPGPVLYAAYAALVAAIEKEPTG